MLKKGKKTAIIAALVPIIGIVVVASLIFAVFQGIVDIIAGVVTSIVDILKDPGGAIAETQAKKANFFADIFNIGNFDINAYRKYNVDARIFISLEEFEKMVAELDGSINRNAAGLDNLTLKNMFLAYYRTIHLENTELYIQLTEEEVKDKNLEKIFKKTNIEQIEGGEKLPHLMATGVVSIKAKDKDGSYAPMIGLSEEGLKKIYVEEYIPNLNDDGSENWYAESIRKALGRCYNVAGNSIKMINFNFEEVESIYEYKDANIKVEEKKTILKDRK